MENTENIDPNRLHDLTTDEVKSYPIFAHFSDNQASEVIQTIKKLTEIVLYDHFKKEKQRPVT
ncbi:hypothetical protein EZ456_23825 [Pedobacter psychrodurus]|uniref:Uncharacterized protein n=1 Tax=Pedobacter psychrodurus TaxID=2530456 RepID=A0A4R0PG16_9SPHI|nr:hypothetical protein [Pedobacter psychrodurus]TCD16980.1 hypothetical protein EZ456_23825 [Pedobacter psychrodurus]